MPRRLLVGFLLLVALAALAEEARAQLAEGERLLALDSLEAADAAFESALTVSPVAARVGRARVALAEGDPRAAEGHAAEALEIAPDDLDAHLVRAIAYRELARHRLVLQRFHWGGAERHFEAVLAADSTHGDVLAEYALLRRYGGRWDEALALAHAAVRLRPDGVRPRLVLYRTYRHLLHEADEDAAAPWLADHPSPFAALFAAEADRRAGRLEAAADALAALDAAFDEEPARLAPLPRTAVLAARARVAFARGESAAGQAFYDAAVEAVDGPAASGVLFEDAAFLFAPEEWARYRTLDAGPDLRAFWRAFWASRDPMPARAVNVRLEEHHRRLDVAEREHAFFGLKSYFNQPAEAMALDEPSTFALGEGVNDPGRVLIRHGEPDDHVTELGPDVESNLSWRYYGDPTLDVHFAYGTGGVGNNWRLTAVPPGYWARDEWGGLYVRLANPRNALDRVSYLSELRDASREDTWRALTTERHTWPEDAVPLDVPYLVAAFREAGGATRLEVHYAVPTAALRDALPDDVGTAEVEVGAALHDDAWRSAGEDRRTEPVRFGEAGRSGVFRFVVPPDSYHVALHARLPAHPRVLGGYNDRVHAPDFSGSGLSMSDLLPAVSVAPGGGSESRGGLEVRPAPDATFGVDEGLFVYFEVYGLAQRAGQTDAEVTYTLAPEAGRRRFFGLFGRDDRPVLTLRTDARGRDPDPQEWAELDVSRVRAGTYTLTVTVTDRHTGASATRDRVLTLED